MLIRPIAYFYMMGIYTLNHGTGLTQEAMGLGPDFPLENFTRVPEMSHVNVHFSKLSGTGIGIQRVQLFFSESGAVRVWDRGCLLKRHEVTCV